MAEHPTPVTPGWRRAAAAIAAVALVGALAASLCPGAIPAGAHSEAGDMTVIVAEQTGPATVRLEVGLTYVGDGHLAEEAVVSASFTGNVEVALDPATLPQISGGRYGADVQLPPGTWDVSIESSNPTAAAVAAVEVSPDFTSPTAAPTTTVVPAVAIDSSSGSSWAAPVIIVAVALALGAAVGVLLAFRRRPPAT